MVSLFKKRRTTPLSVDREPAFVFHHIPKCGGTSFVSLLYEWFAVLSDYEDEYHSELAFRIAQVDTRFLNAGTILSGHWNQAGSKLPERYPEFLTNPRFHVATFLREPLDLQISLFHYTLGREPGRELQDEEFGSLRSFVMSNKNYIAQQLSCHAGNIEETLERYWFIGFVDRFDDSVSEFCEAVKLVLAQAPRTMMAERLSRRIQKVPKLGSAEQNRATRDRSADLLSEEDRAAFRERNALDYLLYEKARERFARG